MVVGASSQSAGVLQADALGVLRRSTPGRPSATPIAVGTTAGAVAAVACAALLLIVWDNGRTAVVEPGSFLRPLNALVVLLPAAVLAARLPRSPIGWLLLWDAVWLAVGALAQQLAVHWGAVDATSTRVAVAAWVATRLATAQVLSFPLLLLLFPSGGLPSRRWRAALLPVLLGPGALLLLALVHPGPLLPGLPGRFGAGSAWELGPVADVAVRLLPAALVVYAVSVAVGAAAILFRYRAAADRGALGWVAGAAAAQTVATLVAPAMGPATGNALYFAGHTAFALAVALSLVGGQLFGVGPMLNRALVYATCTALVALAYLGSAAVLAALLPAPTSLAPVLSAVLVAVVFAPARARVQHQVDRLFYGDRTRPHQALRRLTRRLDATDELEEVAHHLAASLVDALRAPWVSVQVAEGPACEAGGPVGDEVRARAERRPLTLHGRVLGEVRVARRGPGEAFSAADLRLIDDLVRQGAVAVSAVRLSREVAASRERLVRAREEERLAIRRDLHDNLGPTLAAMTMRVDAAARSLGAADGGSARHLAELRGHLEESIREVRRIVHGLRPAVLDDLGLAGALRQRAAELGSEGFEVSVVVEDPGPVGAATEVAAYLIATEALTNARRHSSARRCRVEVRVQGGAIHVVVEDDGAGLAGDRGGGGIGMQSMRERAEELGGVVRVGPGASAGTRVHAVLPVVATKQATDG
ncbi:histidine kinase [Nocardioides sp. GCM10027113]|uniref:histidine kinase n=1 Tax=unclassified Nocardioides TaxID=2615069 RepID=UPI00360F86EA